MRSSETAGIQDATAAELIAAAARKKRAGRNPDGDSHDLERARSRTGGDEDSADAAAPPRKARRRVLRDPAKDAEAAAPEAAAGAGLITRGVHTGLNGIMAGRASVRTLGLWGVAAVGVVLVLLVLSCYASSTLPEPMPVTAMKVTYLPGPHLPTHDINELIRRFPYVDQLKDASPWVLDQLAAYLRGQAAIAEVHQVTVVHQPSGAGGEHLQRTLELVLRLRQPVLPVMLASGERGWVDGEGWLLPGTMPGPTSRVPMMRNLEWGGLESVQTALMVWKQLETVVEPGLISAINLYDTLDEAGQQRGIVFYTRQGGRLIWGRPGEERYGVNPQDKIRDLVRAIRCQGDLNRLAYINVRFHQPFFALRDTQR